MIDLAALELMVREQPVALAAVGVVVEHEGRPGEVGLALGKCA